LIGLNLLFFSLGQAVVEIEHLSYQILNPVTLMFLLFIDFYEKIDYVFLHVIHIFDRIY